MQKINKIKNIIFKIIIGLLVLISLSAVAFVIWANDSYGPAKEAIEALNDDQYIDVTEDEFIIFEPENKNIEKGLIFYPGAKVEPECYATLCREIAAEGYLVVIVPMNMNFAIFSPNKAQKVIEKYDYIQDWAIGGHSLGGVMAAKFATEHNEIKGLALYASYPQGAELKDSKIKSVSIYGSLDGVAAIDKIKNAILPSGCEIIEIKGGNHGNFGTYGDQKGDNAAVISREEQIKQAAEITVKLMESL